MKPFDNDSFKELRARAEEVLKNTPERLRQVDHQELRDIIEEFYLQKAELEIQNEELRRIQQDLEDERSRYADLFDNAPCGYLVTSEKGIIETSNLTLSNMLGRQRRFFVGLPITKLISSDTQDKFYFHRKKLLETKTEQVCQLDFVKKDGSLLPVQIQSVLRRSPEKKLCQIWISATDISELENAHRTILDQAKNLNERIKELNCLHGTSYLIEKHRDSLADVARGAVDLIRHAWRYPEAACTRIVVRGQEFKTENFRETAWKQTAEIISGNEPIGSITICYLEEMPAKDEGPFLKEERALIDTLAERLGLHDERIETRNRLLVSEKKYRMVINNANVGVLITQDGLLKMVNPEVVRMAGYSETELTLKPFVEFVHPDDRAMVLEYHAKRLRGEAVPEAYHFRGIAADGQTKWLENNGVLIDWEGRPASLNFISDITDRKHAEDQIRQLSHMMLKTQERERQMVAYELHDRIAQNLSTLKIGCDTLLDDHGNASPALREKTVRYSKLIEECISDVRNLAYDLRPPGLDEIGLVSSLELYCEEFIKNSGIRIDFQVAGLDQLDMDRDYEIHIVRLIQESLNNIRKHAAATEAKIQLIGAFPSIILRIEDNGSGFDVEERMRSMNNEKRMGLRSMQERVNLLNGRMTVQSRPNKGTRIAIKFPVKE